MFKEVLTKNISERKSFVEDYLPWTCFFAEGIVFNKRGFYQRTYEFRGPDLEAAQTETIINITETINKLIIELGEEYAWQFEAQRYRTTDYPGAVQSNKAAYLVDRERELSFTRYGEHFDSRFYLTVSWAPPTSIDEKTRKFFSRKDDDASTAEEETENIEAFARATNEVAMYLSSDFIIKALNNSETLTYLHSSVSLDWHYLEASESFFLIDENIADTEIDIGKILKIGDKYAPILAINDFPSHTIPLMLDELNRAEIEYRWTTRFMVMGDEHGHKLIKKYQKSHGGKKKSTKDLFMTKMTNTDSGREDYGASALEDEANQIQAEYTMGMYGIGQYSSNIIVWDEGYKEALKKAEIIKAIIRSCGFLIKEETFNAFAAFQSMMPGGVYSNIRRHTITTTNLSHIVPLSAVWAGQRNSKYLQETVGLDIPLVTTNTSYGTPFFLSPWVGDVGMFLVLGPIGAGKSTLLGLLEISFLKYEDVRVIILDSGDSARKLTAAVGGKYYKPGVGLGFQPLRNLQTAEDVTWACEFLEIIYNMQGIELTAKMRNAIYEAIILLQGMPAESRTLTTFHQQVKYTDEKNAEPLKDSIEPYLLEHQYGEILDRSEDSCEIDEKWTMMEMKPIMEMGEKILVPVLFYIFRILDRKFRDNKLSLLTMDEMWKMIDNPLCIGKLKQWVKELRKNKVAIGLATQELGDIADSKIANTLIEECFTKIYLANPMAKEFSDTYRQFGLNNAEIVQISKAQMKHDYFYKSPLGVRLFQLDLGEIMLGLTGIEDEEFYDDLEKARTQNPDKEMVEIILEKKGIPYKHYFA